MILALGMSTTAVIRITLPPRIGSMQEVKLEDIQKEIEKIRKSILNHPKRELLFELDTLLSVAIEEVKRLKANRII